MMLLATASAIIAVGAQNSPEDFVGKHNAAREQVNVEPVSWDEAVASYAQNYADERAAGDCQLVHSGGPYGENLFWGSAGSNYTAVDAVDDWVSEKEYYDYDSNTCAAGEACGHYTQVVWRNSTSIGCARTTCEDGAVFIICNYNPPGNVAGEKPY
jgi:pathogenesis-related protein 1